MDGERDFLKESVLSLSFPDSHAPTISVTVGLDMCTEQANGAESIWPIFVERQRQMANRPDAEPGSDSDETQ